MQKNSARRLALPFLLIASLTALSDCGGGGKSTPQTYTVGGSMSGLDAGQNVILFINNGAALNVTGNGAFTFAIALSSGASYAITVGTQPAGEMCSVAGGSGTIGSANVANAVVTCSNDAFTLGGTIAGLNGSGLVLANGSDTLTVNADATTFTMPTAVAYTSSYNVTVKNQPAGLACAVSQGTGTMPASNVTSVAVSCTDQPFSLGGTITGLGSNSGLVLANGTDTLPVAAGASTFTMPMKVPFGSAYAVTVQSAPAGLTCTVRHGTGTMAASDVTNIAVACSDQAYTLGGTVTGLTASGLVLANGSDTLSVPANATTFTMPSAVAYTSSYAVTVQTQPAGLTCSVANASGTMGTAPVTNIAVTCGAALYTVGGTISGLGSASGLVLANGAYDTLTVLANATSFTMPHGLPNGTPYNITVTANPVFLNCTVTNGTGTVAVADVTNISISCTAVDMSLLYSFGSNINLSRQPIGSLIQASDGNFYGASSTGGFAGAGTVFALTPNGTETVLITGNPGGGSPVGGLIQANDGNLYGLYGQGPAVIGGRVYCISNGCTFSSYAFNPNSTDASDPMGSLTQASDGTLYGMTFGGGASGDGTIFKITPSGTETVLYSFSSVVLPGTTLQTSNARLIQASDGNFYGMTSGGGAYGNGMIFNLTLSGTETVLYSFAGGTTDGATPYGSLIQASDGNFYGMTSGGGAYGLGTVFKITPSGTESVLHSFAGGSTDGSSPYGNLIQASDGNFYGMTYGGGANALGTTFKITPSGTETVLHSFAGGLTDGANPDGSLIQASDGNFYGMTNRGGAYGQGTVFVFH
jgi:uncharacterized repeat protein (TIGR03803 family)